MERTPACRRLGALILSVGLAVASLIPLLTSHSGATETVRLVLAGLLNSGTVWAGLPILAGWSVRGRDGVIVAPIAALSALAIHYFLGRTLGVYESSIWLENWPWFAAALLVGPALGWVGVVARRDDGIGLIARMVVPAGAVAEPLVVGMFSPPLGLSVEAQTAQYIVGATLLTGGLLASGILLRRATSAQVTCRT